MILTTGRQSHFRSTDALGLICETASDGAFHTRFPQTIGFSELFGDREKTRASAAALAHRLVESEPPLRGVQQLRVFEEVLVDELESILLVLNLSDWLKKHNVESIQLAEESWLSEHRNLLASQSGARLNLGPRASKNSINQWCSRLKRIFARILQSKLALSAWSREWRQLLDHFDPYHRRASPWRIFRPESSGGVWFYTTAHTFTDVGLLFERFCPVRLQFLVENPSRGGKPLKLAGRSWISPYRFSSGALSPSGTELERARSLIVGHLRNVSLTEGERRVRDAFLCSQYFTEFCHRLLPLGLYYTSLFDRWAEVVRPAALVAGNFVYEAYALLAMRSRGIPTILLQHGVFGERDGFLEPPADNYIVWGEFWQDFLPPNVRCKSRVLNLTQKHNGGVHKQARAVLFLTAPYHMQRLWSESDLDDILETLLQCALEKDAELIIRVHPMEQIGSYRHRIEKLQRKRSVGRITYSRGDNLDLLLARSAVAVLFSSTVFVDCLRWQVPIISFDWHDFSFKKRIQVLNVFHFAGCLVTLKELVLQGLAGVLSPFQGSPEMFIAATPDGELRREITKMIAHGGTNDAVKHGFEPERSPLDP